MVYSEIYLVPVVGWLGAIRGCGAQLKGKVDAEDVGGREEGRRHVWEEGCGYETPVVDFVVRI